MRALLALTLAIGCSGPGPLDAGPDVSLVDAASMDGGTDAGAADAGCPAARAAACATGGYASFDVSAAASLTARGAVVDDARTGLTWQRATDGVRRTLDDASAYCDALSLEGETDFRLPTRIELLSLVVLGASPTIDPVLAPTEPDYHWSQSVPGAFASTSAFSVYFGAGEVAFALRDRATGLARCVAGAAVPLADRFATDGVGIRDRGTGLLWAADVVAAIEHDEAEAACAPGRVPTLLELSSIVDETRSDPAIDPVFGATPSGPAWTADVDAMGPRAVDFVHGETVTRAASELASLRCLLP